MQKQQKKQSKQPKVIVLNPMELAVGAAWQGFTQFKHYDFEIERAVLGAIMLEAEAMAKVFRILTPEMFYLSKHQHFFRAMQEMYAEGAPIDMLTVYNWLYQLPPDHIIWTEFEYGGPDLPHTVMRCTQHVVSGANLVYHAHILREQFIERRMLMLTSMGMQGADARAKIRSIQQEIEELMRYEHREDWMHVSEMLVNLFKHIQEVTGKELAGITSGFSTMDDNTGGITPGLYYLGARPSVGKTALAIKMGIRMAASGVPVGVISLETENKQLGGRMLAQASGVPFWQIYRGRMTEAQEKLIYVTAGGLSGLPIYISDTPAVGLSDIRSKALKLIYEHGAGVIFIDYIQLVEPDQGAGTREQEVARLSRGLKLLSLQTGIPIIALAQLSRESEKRSDPTPRLIDLRESGSLEQDADGVMLLHRPEKSGVPEDENGPTHNKAYLIVEKWRNGALFKLPLHFIGERMDFEEWPEDSF